MHCVANTEIKLWNGCYSSCGVYMEIRRLGEDGVPNHGGRKRLLSRSCLSCLVAFLAMIQSMLGLPDLDCPHSACQNPLALLWVDFQIYTAAPFQGSPCLTACLYSLSWGLSVIGHSCTHSCSHNTIGYMLFLCVCYDTYTAVSYISVHNWQCVTTGIKRPAIKLP